MNSGDYIVFCTLGMFWASLVMGLSIGDFTFAEEIIDYMVGISLIGYGYSLILRREGSVANQDKEVSKE